MPHIERCHSLQSLVIQLASQHGFDLSVVGQSLRLEQEDQLTLIIHVVGPYRLSVGQYYETRQEILLPFLEILVFTGDSEWVPLEYVTFTRHIYATLDADGASIFSVCVDRGGVVNTIEQWAEQLVGQGWLAQDGEANNAD